MNIIKQDCPECQGEGYLLYLEPSGRYSSSSEAYEAQEGFMECGFCFGEGVREVCFHCQEPLSIEQGLEVCACDARALPKAA